MQNKPNKIKADIIADAAYDRMTDIIEETQAALIDNFYIRSFEEWQLLCKFISESIKMRGSSSMMYEEVSELQKAGGSFN